MFRLLNNSYKSQFIKSLVTESPGRNSVLNAMLRLLHVIRYNETRLAESIMRDLSSLKRKNEEFMHKNKTVTVVRYLLEKRRLEEVKLILRKF